MAFTPWIAIIIFALIIIGGIISFFAFKVSKEEYKKTGKHPKGHYMGLGIAMGIPLGIPIGVALGNIALGPAMGLPMGVAIGVALEKKHAHELRELTEKEEKMKKTTMLCLTGFGLLGVLVFFIVTFLVK